MKKLIRVLLTSSILFAGSMTASAQLMDTIRASLEKRPKFFLSLAAFNTFIDGDYANFDGIRFGLSYNQRIRFGLGFFGLANNSVVSPIDISHDTLAYTTNGQLRLSFVSVSAEYFYHRRYPWLFSVTPLQIGVGSARYEYIRRPESVLSSTETETILLYQPETSAQYNIFKWLGLGVTAGYRIVVYSSDNFRKHTNAPTFSVDLRLFIDEIYHAIFPNGIGGKKNQQDKADES